MLSKEELILKIWNPSKKIINPNYTNVGKMLKYYPIIKETLDYYKINYYPWCITYKEICFNIINNILVKPKCNYCDNKALFTKEYKTYCKLHNRKESIEKNKLRCTGIKQSEETKIKRANSNRGKKRTEETKQNISKGQKNSPLYESHRQKSIDRMSTPEERHKSSLRMKKSIAEGKLTPNITNTWTHFDTIIDDKKFRSSFEGIFHIYHNIYKQKNIEFEKLRIPYKYNNDINTYIVDFIDYNEKKVYEVKPSSLRDNEKNIIKKDSLLKWCELNNFTYYIITEWFIFDYYKEMKNNNFYHIFMDSFKGKYAKFLY